MESKLMSQIGHRDLSGKAIAAAIAVHRELGPGYLESIYEEALCVELEAVGIVYERQKPLPIFYRGKPVGEHRLDLALEGKLLVELKAISQVEDIHFAIVRSYLKAANLEDGLLLNFASMPITIKRVGRSRNEDHVENS
jgi:GxxExxY protein